MPINKDTKIYCSFSKSAGNVGCHLFNTSFQYYNIDAIYKSFSVNNIYDAIQAAKCLQFSGFAISMPFKKEIIKYLDYYDDIVNKTQSCNTVLIKDSKLYGYNTDYYAIKEYLELYHSNTKNLYILGNGGYSHTLQQYCIENNIQFTIITRANWTIINTIKDSVIFNCTPVSSIEIDNTNNYIDCINTTPSGKKLALMQAKIQFKLYTSLEFPEQLFI